MTPSTHDYAFADGYFKLTHLLHFDLDAYILHPVINPVLHLVKSEVG
jgi:hypothetical protein